MLLSEESGRVEAQADRLARGEMEAREDISSKVVLKNALAAAAGRTGQMKTLSVPATALGEMDRGAMEVATEAAPPRALAAEEAAMIPTALTSAQPPLPRRSGARPHRQPESSHLIAGYVMLAHHGREPPPELAPTDRRTGCSRTHPAAPVDIPPTAPSGSRRGA
jgi:hypothetical protein